MHLLPSLKNCVSTKKGRYKLATILDLILIGVILFFGRTPAQKLVSPVISSVHTYYSIKANHATKESFAFVPGLARNKFSYIDLTGLTNLSFFDVPLTEDGEINKDSRGYASFTSAETADLFDRARYQKTKIFLTLSALAPENIKGILDNKDAWEKLALETKDEIENSNIDGITLDFEFPQGGRDYQEKFTNFVTVFTSRMHSLSPKTQIAVAVPSDKRDNTSLYNMEALEKNSDKIFLIASDFVVPEEKNNSPANPVFGYKADEYWAAIAGLLGSLQRRISKDKLVMERAWYGNGDNYPLYVPQSVQSSDEGSQPSQIQLDSQTLENLVAGVPDKGKEAARRNIPLVAEALQKEGILDSNVLAYALATIEHETDGTFEPIGEIQGAISARRLGYEGGANYFGRGFIQITHLRNYKEIGERIGMGDNLVKNPNLASMPQVAAKILAAFFKDNNVANLASNGYFVAARAPINPDYNGYSVANLAMKYEVYQ